MCVKSPNTSFTATVDELSDEEGAQSYIIGCACATMHPEAARSSMRMCRVSLSRLLWRARHLVGSGNAVAEGDRRSLSAVCRGCVVGC